MSGKSFEEFEKEVLIPYFSDPENYDVNILFDNITVRKRVLEEKLSGELKEEFLALYERIERYCDLQQKDSFMSGFISGINDNSDDYLDEPID